MKQKIFLFISFLFIVAIGNSGLTFLTERYGEEKLEWVNHTHEVIIETEKFLSAMQDSETGQRGFLLTGKSSYLEPYYTGVTEAKVTLKKLQELTLDNSEQQKRLVKIEEFTELKFAELDTTISLVIEREKDKALAIVNEDKGKKFMDEIRKGVSELILEERLLLEKRKGDTKAHKAQIRTFIYLEILFFVFLAIITSLFLKNRLFEPLTMLLKNTQKMDAGEKVDITDIVPKDEMGFLLTSFYKMNEKVFKRTQTLHHQAHHDDLTGLENRKELSTKINKGIEVTQQLHTKLVGLFIDLDKFKELNDTLGHDAGDVVLKEVAHRLNKTLRQEDDIIRLGGDEFFILIKDISERAHIDKVVSNINKAFESTVTIQGQPIKMQLSIGIAICPDNTTDADQLLKYADIAMYYSKRDPDSNVTFFEKQMLKRSRD